jgi:NAD(P)-dependent dehydrogenase (short-subunit alcohol dehydrogenase family)
MATMTDAPTTVLFPMTRPELRGIRLFDLTDHVAIVTGAGRGLGQAMALAAAGADVVVSSRTYTELEALRDAIRHLGPRAEAIPVDCTDEASCEQLVRTAIERLGKLDILVNNASINVRKPILELSADEFDRV